MNSKIKTIKVAGEEKEIYITSDGKRFEDKFDAQFYQDELDLEVIEKKCFNKIPENSPASVGSGMNPVFLYVKSFFLRNLSYLS